MSYLNRVWAAATIAVVNGHTDQGGQTLKSVIRSLHHGKKRFSSSSSSGVDCTDFRPISTLIGSDQGGALRAGGGGCDHADESIRQVMYLNCWGPS